MDIFLNIMLPQFAILLIPTDAGTMTASLPVKMRTINWGIFIQMLKELCIRHGCQLLGNNTWNCKSKIIKSSISVIKRRCKIDALISTLCQWHPYQQLKSFYYSSAYRVLAAISSCCSPLKGRFLSFRERFILHESSIQLSIVLHSLHWFVTPSTSPFFSFINIPCLYLCVPLFCCDCKYPCSSVDLIRFHT